MNTPFQRIRRLFARPVAEQVESELEFHIEMRAQDLIAAGETPERARIAARAAFTSRERISEECVAIATNTQRRSLRREYFHDMSSDLRLAFRQLVRAPAFTLGVVITLALGIGVSTSVFSLLDSIFWRYPAGISNPAELQRIWIGSARVSSKVESAATDLDYPRYRAIANAALPATSALYYNSSDVVLHVGTATLNAELSYATASYFPLLGAHPLLGRFYTDTEDRMGAASPVIVLSEAFWRKSFGANADIVGKSATIDHIAYTIIGVAAGPFTGPDIAPVDAWVPFGGYPGVGTQNRTWWESRNYSGFQMVIRPATPLPANFPARATDALKGADRAVGSVDSTARVLTGSIILARGPGEGAPELTIATRLGGVSAMLLLIVMANVVGLMLSRAMRRRHEIGMRLALGISRARLSRLLLTESIVLAFLAAVAATIAAAWGGSLLRSLLFPDVRWAVPPLHWHVLLFAAGAAAAVALIAGLIPLTYLMRSGTSVLAKGTGKTLSRSSSRTRAIAVATQVALSTVLLVGAALFVQSLRNVHSINIGFDADRLLYAAARTNGPDDENATTLRLNAIAQSFTPAQGVEETSRSSAVPLQRGGFGVQWYTANDSAGGRAKFRPTGTRVEPGYIHTIGLSLVGGSDLRTGEHGVVVNQAMADVLWPSRSPIGECIRFGKPGNACHTVVGLVRTAKRSAVTESNLPQYFVASDDNDAELPRSEMLVLRVRPDKIDAVENALHQQLTAAFPDARIMLVRVGRSLDLQYRPWRLGALLFSVFGLLALVIAAVGIYSTISHEVIQRTHDFGVRAALGATFTDIVSAVLRVGFTPVVAGVVIGLVVSLLAGKLVAALLFGISPFNAFAFASAAVVLLGIALLSALVPARRAARVDPLEALRG